MPAADPELAAELAKTTLQIYSEAVERLRRGSCGGGAVTTVGGLCEGYGGLSAAVPGAQLAWYAENDPHAAQVLAHHDDADFEEWISDSDNPDEIGWPSTTAWVNWFCEAMGCRPDTEITVIRWEYL